MSVVGDAEHIRKNVSDNYAKAVTRRADAATKNAAGSCCGAAKQSAGDLTAQLSGYSAEDTNAIPREAVESSFGCGNPLAFSEVQEGQTVVDLGSGAGIDLLIAGRKVGPTGHVIGIDMTDEMIARAEANIAKADMSDYVEVRKGYIEKLPVDDNSVDWVISNCVINLSPEKDKVFAEIARVLKPGGAMLVSDIVVQKLPWWMRRSMALYSACVSGAVSESQYCDGLRAAGLENVDIRGRHIYDAAQIEGIVRTELPWNNAIARSAIMPIVGWMTRQVDGDIQSIQVYAKKVEAPVAACC